MLQNLRWSLKKRSDFLLCNIAYYLYLMRQIYTIKSWNTKRLIKLFTFLNLKFPIASFFFFYSGYRSPNFRSRRILDIRSQGTRVWFLLGMCPFFPTIRVTKVCASYSFKCRIDWIICVTCCNNIKCIKNLKKSGLILSYFSTGINKNYMMIHIPCVAQNYILYLKFIFLIINCLYNWRQFPQIYRMMIFQNM